MRAIQIVFVPLSERSAIPRLWTSDTLYVNCYECKKSDIKGVCIYDILKDSDKKLCPLTDHGSEQAKLEICPCHHDD